MKNEKHTDRPHALSAEATLLQLGVKRESGLSAREAARRRRRLGTNRLWQVSGVPLSRIAAGEIFDLAGVLLLLAVAAAAVFGHRGEAVEIAAILAVSAILRAAAAIAAQRVFLDAARVNIPYASVLRGGEVRACPAENIVPGDILLLSPGDTAPCDARLIDGEADVVETPLTGADGVSRKRASDVLPSDTPCGARSNIVFASTTVVAGAVTAVAIATGERTYAYARRGYIPVTVSGELNAVSRLNPWCRTVSLIMTAAVLLVTLGGFWLGGGTQPLDDLFLSTLSLAVASMSEFLGVIASVILALTVRRLSVGGVSDTLKSPDAIEKAARCRTVVFTTEQLLPEGDLRLGEWFDGEKTHPAPDSDVPQALRMLLSRTETCGGALPAARVGNAAAETVFSAPVRILYERYGVKAESPAQPIAFAPGACLNTVLCAENGEPVAYVSGELADVLSCCTSVGDSVLSPEMADTLAASAERYRARGVRAVAVARRVSPYNHLQKLGVVQSKMTLLGFYTIENPLPPRLGELAAKCREGKIRLVLFAAEEAAARRLAEDAGFLSEEDVLILEDTETLKRYLNNGTGNAVACFCDRAQRSEALRTVCTEAEPAFLTGMSIADMALFPQAEISAAAEISGTLLPQCVQRRADVLIRENGRHASGAQETLRTLAACRHALHTLRGAAQYLLLAQAMRLSVVCAAAVLRLPIPQPPQLLFLGLLLDLFAVLTMAFRAPDGNALALSEKQMQLPRLRDGMLFYIAAGILSGILLSAIPVIFSAAGRTLGAAETNALLFIGCVASSVSACALIRGGTERKKRRGSVRAFLPLAGLALAAAAAEAFQCGLPTAGWWVFLLAALPSLALIILFISYRFTVNSNQK